MTAAFLEGVHSLTLPCTAGLVVPVALVVCAGRGGSKAVVGTVGAMMVGVVARIAGGPELPARWLPVAGVAAAIGFWFAHEGRWIAGVLPALVAAGGWLPCVGPELGALLSGTASLLPGSVAYAAGLAVLPVSVAVVRRASGGWPAVLGLYGGLGYAALTAFGAAAELSAGLARLSA